jgi:diacylglycerol kinase (ATP)
VRSRSLLKSFNYAIDGIVFALRTQRNMRIHFIVAVVVLASGLLVSISRLEFLVLLFAIALVITMELINTAIESAIDVTTTTFDPLAKIAKDVAAAAVLIASLNAVFVGYLIFFFRVNPWTKTVLTAVRSMPVHVTVIALLLVIIAVIVMKALVGEGTFLRGGWPSGHSAIAASLVTALVFITRSALVGTLGLVLAALVFHSRIETGVHTALQVAAGAVLGVLITVLIFQAVYIA